jgi:hypothetical protein
VICHNGLEKALEHNVGSSKEYWTMHTRAIQQGSVEDEGSRCKLYLLIEYNERKLKASTG